MLENIFTFEVDLSAHVLRILSIAAIGALLLYLFLFYGLRSIFRNFERDIALVTLNISIYPVLLAFILLTLKSAFGDFTSVRAILNASLIVVFGYWLVQLFTQVIIYYLKRYTQQTEVMWDNVLLPLVEAVLPAIVFLIGGVFVLKTFGVDLTGIWVTLGGATFIIGFAVKDILANFFSGIVLLIDTPFQFGDILRLEDGSVGMLRKIGVRVTQLYILENHCDAYIPNSVLQSQKITNLSRPTSYYYHSVSLEVFAECDLDKAKKIMSEIVLAHPDTLGNIDRKLEFIDLYYNFSDEVNLPEQKAIGKARLLAKNEVNLKLEEIAQTLEALVVTIQFAEKGGLTPDEIKNIQREYQDVLQLIGLEVNLDDQNNRPVITFVENRAADNLIELVRAWYRAWIKDPNLLDEDRYLIPEEWERKLNLLMRRTQKLYQKISNPKREETRLDDYVMELIEWLKRKFKETIREWQEPQIWMTGVNHDEGFIYVQFKLNFFVDDLKLEDGKRGDRVSSQILQETIRYLTPLGGFKTTTRDK